MQVLALQPDQPGLLVDIGPEAFGKVRVVPRRLHGRGHGDRVGAGEDLALRLRLGLAAQNALENALGHHATPAARPIMAALVGWRNEVFPRDGPPPTGVVSRIGVAARGP